MEGDSRFQIIGNCSSLEEMDVAYSVQFVFQEIAKKNFARMMFSGSFICFCALIGIVGNVISVVVFTRRRMKSSMNHFLKGLAVGDILAILCTVVRMLPAEYFFYFTSGLKYTCTSVIAHLENYSVVDVYTLYAVRPINDMAYTITAYLATALTIERYIAVRHPFRLRDWCSYEKARMSVLSIIIISILINAISYWMYYEVGVFHDGTWTATIFPYTYRGRGFYSYVIWFQTMTTAFLPMLILLVLNIAIYQQIRKANRMRQQLTHSERNELRFTIMMMCIVSVIFLRLVLFVIIFLFEVQGLKYKNEQNRNTEEGLIFAYELLITFNSSINLILYVVYGSQYKETFVELFCSRIPCSRSSVPETETS